MSSTTTSSAPPITEEGTQNNPQQLLPSPCPCTELVTADSIYAVLVSGNDNDDGGGEKEQQERYQRVLDWFAGAPSASCVRQSDCRVQRVHASFHILNAIRAACKPYLLQGEAGSKGDRISPRKLGDLQPNNTDTNAVNKKAPKPTYDQSFPTLGGAPKKGDKKSTTQQNQPSQTLGGGNNNINNFNNNNNNNNNIPGVKKKKKRIRPVIVDTPLQKTSGVWGAISQQAPEPPSNISQPQPKAAAAGVWGSHTTATSGLTTNPKSTKVVTSSAGAWGKPSNAASTTISSTTITMDVFANAKTQTASTKNTTVMQAKTTSTSSKEGGVWGSAVITTKNKGSVIPQQPDEDLIVATPPPTSIAQKTTKDTRETDFTAAKALFSTPISKDSKIGHGKSLTEETTPRRVSFTSELIVTPAKSQLKLDPSPVYETPTKVKPASNAALDRLVEIYCTIVLHNLVPSVALEVHLLLRLLNISESTAATVRVESSPASNNSSNNCNNNAATESFPIFATIFYSGERCRSFAAATLSKLVMILKAFGVSFLNDLVKGTAFRQNLSELTNELETFIQQQTSHHGALLLASDQPALFSGTAQTALLTLPFQHDRDSRHNYRTRDELAIYKNREESRDAFLYQLRSFLNVRGKFLDSNQAQRSMMKIRESCRVVVESVLNVNLPWFSEFFCELLLQVGLVPLEETDKELLNIAGKEKLQKLHKRFSSKVGATQSNKSSWKLAAEKTKKHSNSSVAPLELAQEHFPGHQEFFYLFLVSADSFKFNSHLRNRCVHLIKTKQSSCDGDPAAALEQSLLQLQMLGRFLGVLVFSPTWKEYENGVNIYNAARDSAKFDGLQYLGIAGEIGSDLCTLIEKSQREGSLAKCIAWVVDLLKMASWDSSIHIRSSAYRTLIALLRNVQEQLRNDTYRLYTLEKCNPSSQLVLWCLESLFGEHVGLEKVASFPQVFDYSASARAIKNCNVQIDDAAANETTLDVSPSVPYGRAILFAANPHLEEVFSLTRSLSQTDKGIGSTRSPGISRKLRPSIVSREISPRNFGAEGVALNGVKSSLATRLVLPEAAEKDSMRLLGASSGGPSLEAKMTDAFFHQHQEIKDICEFTVRRVLKRLVNFLPVRVSQTAARLKAEKYHDTEVERAANLLDDALGFLRDTLHNDLNSSLALLEPPNTHLRVRELAVALAAEKGYETGIGYVRNVVTQDLDLIQCSLFGENSRSQLEEKTMVPQGLEAILCEVTTKINELTACVVLNSPKDETWPVVDLLQALQSAVDTYSASTDPKIPRENLLRDHFEAVAKLDAWSLSLVDLCTGRHDVAYPSTEERWVAVASFLRTASKLSRHPRRGLSCVRRRLKSVDYLLSLICLGLENAPHNDFPELLLNMIDGELVSTKALESALVAARENKSDAVGRLSRDLHLALKRGNVLADAMPRLDDCLDTAKKNSN